MATKNNGIRIIHSNSPDYVRGLVTDGWVPIECSMGGESIVDKFQMDHHGKLSHLEGVAVRAYRDWFGACPGEKSPFVVTGAADADATFAIASLAGLLPHPSRAEEFQGSPPWLAKAMTQDLIELASVINEVDCDPIAHPFDNSPERRLLLLWNQLGSGIEDRTAFHAGVDRWRKLTGPQCPTELVAAAGDQEATRVAEADRAEILRQGNGAVALTCKVWGFDVWYGLAPIIVALNPHDGNITIGAKSLEAAEQAFGPGGLKNLFQYLGQGWGGRETIGGSPRGQKMTTQNAEDIVDRDIPALRELRIR